MAKRDVPDESAPRCERPSRLGGSLAALAVIVLCAIALRPQSASLALGPAGWSLATFALAAGAVTAVNTLQARIVLPPATRGQQWLQYSVGLALGCWVILACLAVAQSAGSGFARSALTPMAIVGVVTGSAFIVENAVSQWRVAATARAELASSLARTSSLNSMLRGAESERFTGYRDIIHTQVAGPLEVLATSQGAISDDDLADDIDRFQSEVMRPLAHLLHPASVRVGLIPATRSLAGNFHIEAEPRVVELDAQGALLDDDVRLQVFRWIRYLMPAGDSIDMTISIEGDSLRLHARGVRQSRALDPIQRVAGLAVRSLDSSAERCIIAPRAGTFVGVEDDSLVVPQQIERSRGDRWFLLTRSPVMNVRLVLLVGLVTMPVAIAWANSQFAGAPAVAIILGVLVPAGLAMVLTRIHVPEGTRRGTWLSIGLWLALGIVAGLANILGFWLLAPDTAPWVFIRIVGGLWRYTLIGLLIVAAQGLVAQTMADAAKLRAGIESALADRRGVLAGADRTDRFLSETLHRTVQGRLSAISLLLRFERRPEAIVELGRLVSDTLPTIEARLMEGSNAGIDSSERRVSDEIGLGLNDSVDWASLERSDPELARQFHLVVEECSVNARRHGGAQWMRVFMTVSADWLTLHCHDDGRGPGPQGPGSGLGSRLFDEVCAESGGTWSLVRGDVLTEFALCVPLVPPSRTTGSPEA